MRYATAEHAFNAGKTLYPSHRQWIAGAPSPGEAKKRGQRVALRPDWDVRVRYEVMAEVLRAKFTGPGPVAALLSTGDAMLVEGNRWHDQHWGDCRCGRPACRETGENHLGRMLMERRAELQPEPHHLAHQAPPGVFDRGCPACADAMWARTSGVNP
jgi:ribA/ribD-fused uncharacterized protein